MSHYIRIVPVARHHYRGKRARRQAFYAAVRDTRVLQRIADSHMPAYEAAMADMIVHGIGWTETKFDRGDGEGFTTKPIEYGEWPRAMLRTRLLT